MESPNGEKELQKKEPAAYPRSMKILTTCAVFYGNVTYGCAMNAFSPALTDFTNKYDTDTSTISVVFVASIVCYLLGALLCSVIYNYINRQLVVIALFLGITGAMLAAPHVPTLASFFCIGGLLGFCIGCYDVAQFVWIMEIWQKGSAPFIQAQHFCFAVGTMLAPLIMAPFLTDVEDGIEKDGTTTTEEPKEENTRLFIPFCIIAALCVLTSIFQTLLFIFLRYRPPPPEDVKEEDEPEENNNAKAIEAQGAEKKGLIQKVKDQWPGWPIGRLVILSMLTLGFYQGMEMCTMQLFPTFGQKSVIDLTESRAANTLTALTGAFMVGRGLAIVLIFKIPPIIILWVDIAIVLVGNIFLLLSTSQVSEPMLWVAGILYGFGFSSLLPSFCAYMERYLLFTDTIGALMIVAGAGVGSLYPLIVGEFIDENPNVLAYPIFFSVAMCTVCSVTAFLITRKGKNRVGE